MLISIFLISLIIWVSIRAYLKRSDVENLKTRKKMNYLRGACTTIVPIMVSSAIIFCLQLWINSTENIELATTSIYKLEQARDYLNNNIGILRRIRAWDFFGATLILLISTMFSFIGFVRALHKYNRFLKVLKFTLSLLTILSCFSFFGSTELDQSINLKIANESKISAQIRFNKELLSVNYNKQLEIQDNKVLIGILDILNQIEASELINKGPQDEEVDLEQYFDPDDREFSSLRNQYYSSLRALSENFDSVYDFDRAVFHLAKSMVKYHDANAGENNPFVALERIIKIDNEHKLSTLLEDQQTKLKRLTKEKVEEQASSLDRILSGQRQELSTAYSEFGLRDEWKPIFSKAIRFASSETLRPVIKAVSSDNPVLDIALRVIVNIAVEKKISKKIDAQVERLLFSNSGFQDSDLINEKIIADNLSQTESLFSKYKVDFRTNFDQTNSKIKSLSYSYYSDLEEILERREIEKERAERKKRKQIANLENTTKFERTRKEFLDHAFLDILEPKKKQQYVLFLDSWEEHKWTNIEKWSEVREFDLEKEFINFIKKDATRRACWGFMLQQEHFYEASNFYFNHPKGKLIYAKNNGEVTGKPYFMLAYYLGVVDESIEINDFYDRATDRAIGGICPP